MLDFCGTCGSRNLGSTGPSVRLGHTLTPADRKGLPHLISAVGQRPGG